MIQEEENLERASHTIPPGACPDAPPHLEEFDRSYIREYSEDVVMRCPIDTHAHLVLNYAQPKDLEIDYRFWNEFHSNFYASVIFNSKKSKIVKMQYVDQEEIKGKNEPECNKMIKACELLASLIS